MKKQEVMNAYQDIKSKALSAIQEHNEGEYTQEEKDFNQQHWQGIIIGAESMMKKLFGQSTNFFNFDKN